MDIADISTWQIVKWVAIVLVAAFIGQFGKTFAQCLMNRFQRRKQDKATAVLFSETGTIKPAGVDSAFHTGVDDTTEKIGKKETKALLKFQKKANKKS